MVDCVTNERLDGIINAENPYQVWLNHIISCAPAASDDAAVLGLSGANVTISESADGRFYVLANDRPGFILEVALTQAQAESLCSALGWNIT